MANKPKNRFLTCGFGFKTLSEKLIPEQLALFRYTFPQVKMKETDSPIRHSCQCIHI